MPIDPITIIAPPAVIPVLIGPLQVLLVALPALVMALLGILSAILRPKKVLGLLRLIWRQRLPVFVLLAVLLAGRMSWLRLFPSQPDRGATSGAVIGTEWSMFRGSLGRSGSVDGAMGPLVSGINWSWQQKGEAFLSSPALAGGRLYATSADTGIFNSNRRGYIYCLDRLTGRLLWRDGPRGYQPTFSSPVISGKYLVCGEGLHSTRNARIVAMDISDDSNPRVIWTLRTESHVECTPVISGGRAYVGAGDDGYYCVELEPDSSGNAVVVWHLDGADYPDAETALAVYGGRVYAGLGIGGEALCILDAETGREIKRLRTGYPVFTPPSIHKGRLYIGMGNGNYVYSASQVRMQQLKELKRNGASQAELAKAEEDIADGGEVWCVDLETLEKVWSYKCRSTVLGAVTAVDDGICFTTRDGQVNRLDSDGHLIASRDLQSVALSSPAVTGEFFYQMTADGRLYALRAKDLVVEWDVKIGRGSLCVSSPALSDGVLYIGTEMDGIISLGSRDVEDRLPTWSAHLGGAGRSGNPTGARLSPYGDFLWQYPSSQVGKGTVHAVVAPAASVGDRLYVPMADLEKGLACFEIKKSVHETPKPRWVYRTKNGVACSPVVSEDRIFITDTGDPGTSGRLHCIAPADGSAMWQKELEPAAPGFLVLYPDILMVQDGKAKLSGYDFKGNQVWSISNCELSYPPSGWNGAAVLVSSDRTQLSLIDALTGKYLWRAPLESAAGTAPVVYKDSILIGTAKGLEYRSLLDGSIMTIATVREGCSGTVAVSGDRIFCASAVEKSLLEFADGRLVKEYSDIEIQSNPVPLGDGTILLPVAEGLLALNPAKPDAQPLLWADSGWLGDVTSHLILHNRSIYMGISGWGMVCIGSEQ